MGGSYRALHSALWQHFSQFYLWNGTRFSQEDSCCICTCFIFILGFSSGNHGTERHLPPQEEGHDDQDDAEAAEDDAHQNGQVVVIMRLPQQRLQLLAVRLQLYLLTEKIKIYSRAYKIFEYSIRT